MRFIRKNGRVIPIKDGRDERSQNIALAKSIAKKADAKYSAAPEYRKTAKLSAVTAVAQHGMNVAVIRKSKTGAIGLAGATVGLSVANMVHQVRASRRESAAKGNNFAGNIVKHTLVQAGVQVAGNAAGAAALKHSVKASIIAGEGSRAAAKGFHAKVKPFTSKMAENRRFKKAKWVHPVKPKLLK